MSDKKLFHNMKKQLNVYKTSTPTKDPEYDEVYMRFKDIGKQVDKLSSSMKQSKTNWDPVKRNIILALDSVKGAFVDGRVRGLADDARVQVDDWSQQLTSLKENEQECRFNEAERMLTSYVAFVKSINSKCSKRNDLVKNLDYYRGKVEEFNSKPNTKPKEQERLRRAELDMQHNQDEFDSMNRELIGDLHKAVDYKEDVFTRCLVAYLDYIRQTMALTHFAQIVDNYDDVLRADWPHIDEVPNNYSAPPRREPSTNSFEEQPHDNYDDHQSHNGSYYSGNDMAPVDEQPPDYGNANPEAKAGEPQQTSTPVRALYEFEATNDEELSFNAGDEITLYEVLDENWMYGGLNGKDGIFPCNYVEYI